MSVGGGGGGLVPPALAAPALWAVWAGWAVLVTSQHVGGATSSHTSGTQKPKFYILKIKTYLFRFFRGKSPLIVQLVPQQQPFPKSSLTEMSLPMCYQACTVHGPDLLEM